MVYQLPMHSFLLLSIHQNSFLLRYRKNVPNVDHFAFAVTRMLNENAFATVLGYDAAGIGSLSSAPTMIAPDESNEYSKHIY